jgi:hypothetical protein
MDKIVNQYKKGATLKPKRDFQLVMRKKHGIIAVMAERKFISEQESLFT